MTERQFRCDGEVREHRWTEEYYGSRCADCGLFFAEGCAPWDDVDGGEEDFDGCGHGFGFDEDCEWCDLEIEAEERAERLERHPQRKLFT